MFRQRERLFALYLSSMRPTTRVYFKLSRRFQNAVWCCSGAWNEFTNEILSIPFGEREFAKVAVKRGPYHYLLSRSRRARSISLRSFRVSHAARYTNTMAATTTESHEPIAVPSSSVIFSPLGSTVRFHRSNRSRLSEPHHRHRSIHRDILREQDDTHRHTKVYR